MRIFYDNLVEDATITSYTEHPQMTWENALLDGRLSRVGQTIGDEDEWIKFSFSSAQSASYCFIFNHNISASATLTLQANSSDSWGSPALSETMTIDDICYVSFTEASYQYWRVFIDDPTNPDSYIQLSKIFLGTYLQMPSFSRVFKYPRKSTSVASKSTSGQLYGDRRIQYNSAEFSFNNVSNSKKVEIDTFYDAVENIKPFVLLVWEDDIDVQEPLYVNCTNETGLAWEKEDSQDILWRFSLNLEECF